MMAAPNEEQYQTEVRELYDSMHALCTGHGNQVVLHAIARLLWNALDPQYFRANLTLGQRIENVSETMRAMLEMMARKNDPLS